MRIFLGALSIIVAALIFPGSLIPLPASDALLAAVSGTLFMTGVNFLIGVPYSMSPAETEPAREEPEAVQG